MTRAGPTGEPDAGQEIIGAYHRQAARWTEEQYRSWMPGNLFAAVEMERVLVGLLRDNGLYPLEGKEILEVGCGSGRKLAHFLARGSRAADLHGIDLLPDQIARARLLCPSIDFRHGDARALPYDDASMDIVLAFTSFSSMTDSAMREQVAHEIRRVLRPTGVVVWYDFWIVRGNPDVTSIGLDEVRSLFQATQVDARRVSLAPPIARPVAGRSWFLATLLNQVPLLRTHWLAIVRPAPLGSRLPVESPQPVGPS